MTAPITPAVQRRRDEEFEKAASRFEVDRLLERWQREDDAAARVDNALAKEVADLRRRIATLERTVAHDGPLTKGLVSGIAASVRTYVAKAFSERCSMSYRGTHDDTVESDARGDCCTWSGSGLDFASATKDRPGKSSAWRLIMKGTA